MTNKKAIALVLGVMCFALTSGICIQVKTVKKIPFTFDSIIRVFFYFSNCYFNFLILISNFYTIVVKLILFTQS